MRGECEAFLDPPDTLNEGGNATLEAVGPFLDTFKAGALLQDLQEDGFNHQTG